MKVLFVGMQWDYGDSRKGLSFEFTNLFDAMRKMEEVDAQFFDFMTAYQHGGEENVRKGLLAAIDEWRPGLVFFVLFKDEIPRDVLAELRDRRELITFNWFCDDHWRFDSFTKHYAPLFNACSTTAASALPKYRKISFNNVIKTQWGCNHHSYRPSGVDLHHKISFVGQPHGDRREILSNLKNRGIDVETWGEGWENGRLTQEELIHVFSESQINLNLSNASHQGRGIGCIRRQTSQQVKGRNFEIAACRGFQISGEAENLASYFEPEREIVIYTNEEDLVEKIERFSNDPRLCAQIAERGYKRALAEHTYSRRFTEIFEFLDLC
jgi:spore maturation protein CgeB